MSGVGQVHPQLVETVLSPGRRAALTHGWLKETRSVQSDPSGPTASILVEDVSCRANRAKTVIKNVNVLLSVFTKWPVGSECMVRWDGETCIVYGRPENSSSSNGGS